MRTSWTADRRLVAVGMAATVVVGSPPPRWPTRSACPTSRSSPTGARGRAEPLGAGHRRPRCAGHRRVGHARVVNAQPLFDGTVLVATRSADPSALSAIPGVLSVEQSAQGTVLADPTDPYWSTYGYNLENTGSNAAGRPARADADVDATAGWASSTGAGMSSPWSTPATTPTTRTSPARCGPTRRSLRVGRHRRQRPGR